MACDILTLLHEIKPKDSLNFNDVVHVFKKKNRDIKMKYYIITDVLFS